MNGDCKRQELRTDFDCGELGGEDLVSASLGRQASNVPDCATFIISYTILSVRSVHQIVRSFGSGKSFLIKVKT